MSFPASTLPTPPSRWSLTPAKKSRSHPSPAVGSPSAEMRVGQPKKLNTATTPKTSDSPSPPLPPTTAAILTNNQRAFAARFAAPTSETTAPPPLGLNPVNPNLALSEADFANDFGLQMEGTANLIQQQQSSLHTSHHTPVPANHRHYRSPSPTSNTPYAAQATATTAGPTSLLSLPMATITNTSPAPNPYQEHFEQQAAMAAEYNRQALKAASSKAALEYNPTGVTSLTMNENRFEGGNGPPTLQHQNSISSTLDNMHLTGQPIRNMMKPLLSSDLMARGAGEGGVNCDEEGGELRNKLGPPVVPNQVGMGGLQSPVQVGGFGFVESGGKKQGSSRRRSSSKKNSTKGGGGRWTKEEDQKLRAAVAQVGPQNWKMIAQDFLGEQRSDVQCLHRWQKVLQPGLVKGPWTKEEDQIIIDCIDAGITKWSEIAERIPGRIGKQCRERWFNHLDPSLKKGGWTEEEDAILVEAQAKWGNCWTKIAKLLPGRSENAVKNRWNSATRRRAKINAGKDGVVETKYLENLNETDPSHLFPSGMDTTASAVLAAARRAAAKIIAEEAGKLEPEDDDPDTIKLSAEARQALMSKKRQLLDDLHGPGGDPDMSLFDTQGLDDDDDDDVAFDFDEEEQEVDGVDGVDGLMIGSGHTQLPSVKSPPTLPQSTKKASRGKSKSPPVTLAPATASAHEFDLGMGLGESDDFFNIPDAKESGEKKGEDSKNMMYFEDQNLSEREKDLIHRAYLAGQASKGGEEEEAANVAKAKKSSAPTGKRKGKKTASTASAAGEEAGAKKPDGVQWDFNMNESSSASGGFGMEFGLNEGTNEFTLGKDPKLVLKMTKQQKQMHQQMLLMKEGLEMSEDPELSNSLLNMSLDKDMLLDEMGLSLSDRSVLARPLDSGAMESLQAGSMGGGDGEGAGSLVVNLDGGSKGKWGNRTKKGGAGGLKMSMSPTAVQLHQLSASYRQGDITEEQKNARKAALLNEAALKAKVGGRGTAVEEIDPDILDPDQSVDLSTDLANFMGSPNFLMSMSGSGGSVGAGGGGPSPVPVGGVGGGK